MGRDMREQQKCKVKNKKWQKMRALFAFDIFKVDYDLKRGRVPSAPGQKRSKMFAQANLTHRVALRRAERVCQM